MPAGLYQIVAGVSARDVSKDRGIAFDTARWFSDPVALARSPDIDLFVEAAKRAFPGLPIYMIGHSMGGFGAASYGLIRILPGDHSPLWTAVPRSSSAVVASTTVVNARSEPQSRPQSWDR